jgi:hypothetical protein
MNMQYDIPAMAVANAPLSETLLAAAINTVDACVAILSGPELRYTFANEVYQAISPDVAMLVTTLQRCLSGGRRSR